MLIDLDAPTLLVPTAWVDGQTLEVEEDLNMVIGDFDLKLLVPMDMRGAVIIALDAHIAVSVEFCLP